MGSSAVGGVHSSISSSHKRVINPIDCLCFCSFRIPIPSVDKGATEDGRDPAEAYCMGIGGELVVCAA